MRFMWLPLLVALATWDAWRWYLARVREEPEQGLVLLLTVAFLAALGSMSAAATPDPGWRPPYPTLAVALVLYAASYTVLPPILRAGIAVPATLLALGAAVFRATPPVAAWGLAALSLPVLPSLQFVLGFPMRAGAAAASAALLQLHGLGVTRQGTLLSWQGRMVEFDAPCSGVNMLWAGLMLALMASALLRLDAARTFLACGLAVAATLAGNVLRGTSLFYIETGLLPAPAWWHEAVGMAAFALAAAATLGSVGRLARRESRT